MAESNTKFIFATIIFVSFMLWLETSIGFAVISGNPNLTVVVPTCNSTYDPLFFFCSLEWAGFIFVGLPSLNSSFVFVNLFIVALTMANIYIVLRLFRGGG